jgi:hypothetical protein
MDDDRVAKLKTPEECVIFEQNATRLGHCDLAVSARKRAVELRAEKHGAKTNAERECLEAVYAYEEVLTAKNGKRTRASRTWPMIARHGILGAVERAVNRPDETVGYTSPREMGLEEYAFESVVVRYPSQFSPEAVSRSEARINEWNSA